MALTTRTSRTLSLGGLRTRSLLATLCFLSLQVTLCFSSYVIYWPCLEYF
jgi:hypothetical protein